LGCNTYKHGSPISNSLCSVLNNQKYHFVIFFFSYTKLENKRTEQVLTGLWVGGGLVPVGGGGGGGKVRECEYGENLVAYVCKWKNDFF
jgi:hypothetical protein